MKITRHKLDTFENGKRYSTAHAAYRLDSSDGRSMYVSQWDKGMSWETISPEPSEIEKYKRDHGKMFTPTFRKLDDAVEAFDVLCDTYPKE